MEILRLEQGIETECPDGNTELINGVVYEKAYFDEKGINAVKYLHTTFDKFRLINRPLDKVVTPQTQFVVPGMDNTILKPELAVTVNGENVPTWVVEFADEETEEIAYLAKPAIYRNAGISEYWIIDTSREVVLIYQFEKNGLVPTVLTAPQRIKVGIYKTLFISFSELFKTKKK